LLHGGVYEYKFEYIDKETKLPVSKIVRFNDPNNQINKKLSLLLLVHPLDQRQEEELKYLRD